MNMENLEDSFKKMMKDSEGNTTSAMKDIEVFKINWDICGLKGDQVFENDNYTYKLGEHVDDPDVSISAHIFVGSKACWDDIGTDKNNNKNYIFLFLKYMFWTQIQIKKTTQK